MKEQDLIHARIQQFEVMLRCLGECIQDISTGTGTNYNLDFSLLGPVVFDFPGHGSKDFLQAPAAATRRVLNRKPGDGNFEIVLTGATMAEFFDQMVHSLDDFRHRFTSTSEKYKSMEPADLENYFVSSADIREELAALTKRGVDQKLRRPIDHLMRLIQSGAVRGIGDVVDVDAVRSATDVREYSTFLEEQEAIRSKFDKDRRPVDDSRFHYRMDAVSNSLTLATARADVLPTMFVTTTHLNLRQCTIDDVSYARLHRTPLYRMNIARFAQLGHIGSEIEFFEDAANECFVILEQLRRYPAWASVKAHLKLRIANFYSAYASPLGVLNKHDERDVVQEFQEVAQVIHDPSANLDFIAEAEQIVRDGAVELEKASESMDLDYLESFDLSDDPVIARMREKLGVKFRT